MRLATLKIMRVINDKIYPRGKWMSFTNTTRQVVQFAFSAGRDSVAVLVWRGDRAVARISKSAVSRVSNPQTLRRLQSRGTGDGSADWKSAIQQVGNRYVQRVLNRYVRGQFLVNSLLIKNQLLVCGFACRRVFTGN